MYILPTLILYIAPVSRRGIKSVILTFWWSGSGRAGPSTKPEIHLQTSGYCKRAADSEWALESYGKRNSPFESMVLEYLSRDDRLDTTFRIRQAKSGRFW